MHRIARGGVIASQPGEGKDTFPHLAHGLRALHLATAAGQLAAACRALWRLANRVTNLRNTGWSDPVIDVRTDEDTDVRTKRT